jgi:type II secretory pathway pseudopilin PulG
MNHTGLWAPSSLFHRKRRADWASFTLIEMMASMAIVFILMGIISIALGGISKLWLSQRNHAQTFQGGRSALDLMVRDLTALETPRSTFIDGTSSSSVTQRCNLQFIQDAGDPSTPTQPLNGLLANSGYQQVPYSSSVFGQARLDNTPQGNLWIIGYYLARSTDKTHYQLRKFLISPAGPSGSANSANPLYLLYPNSPTATASSANGYSDGQPSWIYLGTTAPNPTAFQTNSYVVSENVVALWFRCLDNTATPIPWLDTATPTQPNTAPFKFNSAAPFVMAPVIGATNSATATNFIYQVPGNILMANRLPAALEITAISVDSQAVTQLASTDFPAANPVNQPSDVSVAATNYLQQLYVNHISSARIFKTVVRLPEAN